MLKVMELTVLVIVVKDIEVALWMGICGKVRVHTDVVKVCLPFSYSKGEWQNGQMHVCHGISGIDVPLFWWWTQLPWRMSWVLVRST